jgi:hypothetical protein
MHLSASLPLVVLALALGWPGPTHPQDPATPPPVLVPRSPKIELQRSFDDEQTEFSVHLRNTTDQRVPLRKVHGSCGCIRTGNIPASIGPREEVEIAFVFRLRSFVGRFEKAVFVEYGERTTPPLRIPVTGEIGYRLLVEPMVAYAKRTAPDVPATTELVVTSNAGESLADLSAVASEPAVVIERQVSGTRATLRITVPPEVKNLHGTLTLRLGNHERVLRLTDGTPPPIEYRAASTGARPGARREGAGTLAVAFTGQDRGELEPCGCTQGMLGGLARRPARLRAFTEPGLPLLTVSGGELVDGSDDLDRLRLRSILGGAGTMGYHALAPSRRDLELGAGLAATSAPLTAPPLVAVNVDESTVGERNLQRMLCIETGAATTYVTGIAAEDTQAVGDLKFTDTIQALRELRGDMPVFAPLIVIANVDGKTARQWLRFAGRPTLILYASPFTDPGPEDVEEGPVALAPMPTNGKYVGLARLYGSGDEGTWGIEFRPVAADLPEDPGIVEQRRQHQQRMRDAQLVARGAKDPRFTPHALSGEPAPAPVRGAFVGSASCTGCHPDAALKWTQSKHAAAMATLHKVGSDGDPSCVSCHVVGYGTGRAFSSEASTPEFASVGCESCHGARADHVAFRMGPARAATEKEPVFQKGRSSCASCHDSKHDPKFDFDAYWQRIAHGAK